MKRLGAVLLAAATFVAATSESTEGATVFTGSSGSLSAKATFTDLGSGTLQVLLENLGDDVMAPADLLTAIFFDYSGGVLTPLDAIVGPNSLILFDNVAPPTTFGPGTDIGGEWAYKGGLSGAPGGATHGIGSAGFSLFGPDDRFDTSVDLDNPASPNGMNYGLTSVDDDLTTGNAVVTGDEPIVKYQAVFTLSYTGDFGSFSNVSFQYGTRLNEPNVQGEEGGGGGGGGGGGVVPEPSSLALLGGAIGLAGLFSRRRKQI